MTPNSRILLLLLVLISLLALTISHPVFAHGDEPRLEISVEKTNPGGVIEVRGVDFESDELIVLDLVGPNIEVPLGEVTADIEGLFVQIVTLPVDSQEGTYSFRATTNDHVVVSPSFQIWGTAILEREEGGPREEEDGLLAPMPTYEPDFSSTPIPQSAFSEDSVPAQNSSMPFVWIAAGIGIIVVLGLFIKARR